jgi:TFIIF-interacting CTD phosphatase-like protein
MIKYRLYRDSCINADDSYVKDLNILGRDLKQTLIVDNTLHAFAYQVNIFHLLLVD